MKSIYRRDPLGFRLVLASVLIGSVLSIFSTGVQLLVSFESQKNEATAVFDQIETALAETLELALWTFDFDQVNIILDGIASNQNVTRLELVTPTGHRWTRGTATEAPLEQVYDLVFEPGNAAPLSVGTLTVDLSLDAVVNRVWEQFWVTFLSNLVKAYVAALALLLVMRHLITRHLRAMAQHFESPDDVSRQRPLSLDRKPTDVEDDLDRIIAAIALFQERVRSTMLALQNEIEDRIESEQEAREALSVRSTFLSTMSHEIRTPLNAIMGFLHLIQADETVPERQRKYADMAAQAAQALHSQLTNVLEMSRLDSNAIEIRPEPTDIRRLANQWLENAKAGVQFRKKDLEVTLDLDPGLQQTYALDGPRLSQIVTNLVDNATKFTSKGRIEIFVRSPDNNRAHGLEIGVADTGPGISRTHTSEVFERFAQLDTGLDRAHGGSGLGLAISRELTQLMGGALHHSPQERDGFTTVFLITLDCIPEMEPT